MKEKSLHNKIIPKDNPTRLLLNLYIIVVIIGTILLILPFTSRDRSWTNALDALFTTVSAVCVTGLTTVTTALNWSISGKVVIIILIQLGGLGVMTASSLVAIIFNKRLPISTRLNLAEENNVITLAGIFKMIQFILIGTFLIEFVGAVFLAFTFIPEYGVAKGIAFSIFHAISAFCNAGFDIIGESSLTPFALNINVSLVISLLIIIGGIGHRVIMELCEKKFNYKKYTVHTKLVLVMTAGLLIIPTIFFMIVEWNNPNTIGKYSFFEKFLLSFFQSTTLRTAGFFTVNQSAFLHSTTLIGLILMFIGGSPAGTAGGFKTTTTASLFLITKANVKKEKDINIFKRRIPDQITAKVVSIFTISVAWIFTAILIISISDPQFSLLDIVFEVFSAYGTVGLTRGITPLLSPIAKLVIILTMLFGKLGPLSIVLAFMTKKKPKEYREKEESIIIG